MKKIYRDPQVEMIELDALITTMDVSETEGAPGSNVDETVNDLFDDQP